jgi:hypothetical protein
MVKDRFILIKLISGKRLRMARTAFTVLSESLVTPEEQIQGKIAYQNLRDAQDARNAFTADQSAY